MSIDVRTMIVMLGLSHLLQVFALSVQYVVNKAYRGIGWWLLWSTAAMFGFIFMLLRDVPSLRIVSIVLQNGLIVLGVTFLYVGLMRFYDRTVNRMLLAPILVAYFTLFFFFLFFVDDIDARSVVISAALALISFLTAWDLFALRAKATRTSALFLCSVLLAHGLFFLWRTVAYLAGARFVSPFSPTPFNVAPYVDGFVVGNLLAVGVIILTNQRAHAEMREARDHFELLFNASPEAVLITRVEDGVCREVNLGFETLSGFGREEILGHTPMDIDIFWDPADRQKVVSALRERGTADSLLIPFRRKDGTRFVGSVSARILPLGDVPHILSVTRDMTEQQRAEEALAESARQVQELNVGLEIRVAQRTAEMVEANRELEALVHSIAHDLRAPLRAIDGFSAVLEERAADRLDEEERRLVGKVRAGAQRMDRIIRDLVDYAAAGDAAMSRERVDVAALARAAFNEVATDEVRRTFAFDVSELPEAEGDPGLLRVVFRHLLSNAVKYTLPRAVRRVRVSGERDGDSLVYHVADSGVGFDAAHAHRLFGRFQRLHGGAGFEGTGIGLALVKRIVERHGGRTWAEGAPDEGATISFSLPAGGKPGE